MSLRSGQNVLTQIQDDKKDGGVEPLGVLLALDPRPCHSFAAPQTRTLHLVSHMVALLSSPRAMVVLHNSPSPREVDMARRRVVAAAAAAVDSKCYWTHWRQR